MTEHEGPSISSLWARDADLEAKIHEQEAKRAHARGWTLFMLAFSTLGVVYGDIGTSPLYVYGAVFPDGAPAEANVVYGTFSTIFWTITYIVLVKYLVLTMRADDNGEGGIFALYALIARACGIRQGSAVHEADLSLSQYTTGTAAEQDAAAWGEQPRRRRWREAVAARTRGLFERSAAAQTALLVVVLLSASMILSDGVLTPAISVVSAIEGIQFQTGISTATVVGISIGILIVLFAFQSLGTQRVSGVFSPVMLAWFLFNAGIGVYNLTQHGASCFKALSPHYMYWYWSGRSYAAWQGLGNIMLCVTGAEALYADMGHFSVRSIRLSFAVAVYPSLVLTYLGQTAMIVARPEAAAHAYWEAVPSAILWPAVVLATGAAIIASQALITGAFSILQQAISMNAFPRLTIRHTSAHIMGQVYIPEANWLLLIGAIVVVGVFQTSAKISNAYGLAVVTVMLLDTSLLALVMVTAWEWSPVAVFAFWLPYTVITGAFFSSNVQKVPKGAWFSLALAAVLSLIAFIWHWGQHAKLRLVRDRRMLLRDLFLEEAPGKDGFKGLGRASATSTTTVSTEKSGGGREGAHALRLARSGRPVARLPGVCIYFNELLIGVPPVLERFVELVPALHSVVVFLTVRIVPVPVVLPSERLLLRRLRFPGFYHVVARYGYQEQVDAGEEFVEGVLAEIYDYLHPMTGLADLTAADGSVHRAVAELSTHGGAAYAGLDAAAAAQAPADIELGLVRPTEGFTQMSTQLGGPSGLRRLSMQAGGPPGLRRVSMNQGVVRVDAAESLTAVTGRRLGGHLSVQLMRLSTSAAANDDTVQSRASTGRRRLPPQLGSAITVAVPLAEERGRTGSVHPVKASEWKAGQPEPEPAPWVQMPSVVRRVRAQMLGHPEPLPGLPPGTPSGPARGDTAAEGDTDATLSLPLPGRRRPPLPPPARDYTLSLPLPPATSRPALQSVRRRAGPAAAALEQQPLVGGEAAPALSQQAGAGVGAGEAAADTSGASADAGDKTAGAKEAAAQLARRSGGGPTAAQTLSKSAAAELGQQPWQRLQRQRYLGQGAGEAMETVTEAQPGRTASPRLGLPPTLSSATPSVVGAESMVTEVAMQREMSAGGDAARRQLFDVHAHANASQLQDVYAAEREALLRARAEGVAYLVGRSALRAAPSSRWFKRFLVESLYGTLAGACRPTTASYNVPPEGLLTLGVDYQL